MHDAQLANNDNRTLAADTEDRDAHASDPLLVTCRLVGDALGMTIRANRSLGSASHADPLAEIAAASRIRTRQVLLRGEWWRWDNGPLLAYREADNQPVALLPRGAQQYVLVDPLDRTPTPVSVEIAATLASFAVMFYRPLPERPLSTGDVVRFALRGSRYDLVRLLGMGMASGTLALGLPLATWALFDTIIPAGQVGQVFSLGAALAVAALSSATLHVLQTIALVHVQNRSAAPLQAALWDRLLALPASFFHHYAAGDLGDRVLSFGVLSQTLAQIAADALLATIVAGLSLGLLVFIDPTLALVALGLVGGLGIVSSLISRSSMQRQRALAQGQGRLAGLVLQSVMGIAKFRVAGAEHRAFQTWADALGAQATLLARVGRMGSAWAGWNAAFPLLATIAMVAATIEVTSIRPSLGAFLAVMVAFTPLMGAALTLHAGAMAAARMLPLGKRLEPILQALPEVDEARTFPGTLSGAIEVDHVTFRYRSGGPPILHDVSLTVRPGEFVALVGPSGSGKSTLLRVLLGFERPEAGMIRYDGHDLAGLDVRSVRRQLGVALQQSALLPADIFHNIIGSSLLTVEDAREAARMVGIADEIEQMPMGMHTLVAEGGSTFSGGQRQRLLIARALVHKPRILLLDEATSALDNTTQATVSASVAQLQATRIVIAHRLSTIMHADRIYVFDRGHIVQRGTYAELMRQNGVFAELARRQLS